MTFIVNTKLDKAVTQLTELNEKFDQLEKDIQDCSNRVETIINDFLPKLSDKVSKISTALTMRILDNDVHKRKWSIIIHGLKGPAGESKKK